MENHNISNEILQKLEFKNRVNQGNNTIITIVQR